MATARNNVTPAAGALQPGELARLRRPLLVATTAFPPGTGGSAILMKNLTDAFAPGSLVLALERRDDTRPPTPHGFRFVTSSPRFSARAGRLWRRLEWPLAARRMARLARENGCGAVLGVFPDVLMLTAALEASRLARLPFVAYLHDTIVESLHSRRDATIGARTQREVFQRAGRIFVMSQAMEELYRDKYGVETEPIVHVYPEPIPARWPGPGRRASVFWSGNVYNINRASVLRVHEAVRSLPGIRMVMALKRTAEELAALGFDPKMLETAYFPATRRHEFLGFLREQSVALVALSWPDESPVGEDELRTIFSTKIPEYLAAGRPVLVHCPEHYFMARFFREHGCGEVVSERSVEALRAAIERLTSEPERARRLGERAMAVAPMFSREAVAGRFAAGVESVMRGA